MAARAGAALRGGTWTRRSRPVGEGAEWARRGRGEGEGAERGRGEGEGEGEGEACGSRSTAQQSRCRGRAASVERAARGVGVRGSVRPWADDALS
jgi:hypothetical protein